MTFLEVFFCPPCQKFAVIVSIATWPTKQFPSHFSAVLISLKHTTQKQELEKKLIDWCY